MLIDLPINEIKNFLSHGNQIFRMKTYETNEILENGDSQKKNQNLFQRIKYEIPEWLFEEEI